MSMETEQTKPYKFKLIRGGKGKYRWEITVTADMRVDCLESAKYMDEEAKSKWGAVSE